MKLDEYQQEACRTDIYKDDRDCVLGLASEAGEVAGKVSKVYRDGGELFGNTDIAYEIGDVLWYCAAVAHRLWFDLSEIAKANLFKLQSRKKRGCLGGSGDYR